MKKKFLSIILSRRKFSIFTPIKLFFENPLQFLIDAGWLFNYWFVAPFDIMMDVISGISSWGRKVGRRLELLTIADNETLTYNVNPGYSRPSQYSRYEGSKT